MPKWIFPLTHGGQHQGINDAGINTFTGDYEKYIAREAIQNVLDAKKKARSAVRVRFDLNTIATSRMSRGFEKLKEILESCADFYKKDVKAKAFFKRALSYLDEKHLPVLSIRDYNTTGLTGDDNDREGNWYSLIQSVGNSLKGGDAGGSFGIGKNAPFAASALRTVFYSTKLADGSVAFQGVSRLVTHEDREGETVQSTGYFGGKTSKGYPCSVRSEADIPAPFRRQEQGTDIHILGYLGSENWKEQLERAALEHFWPAVHWGDLVIEIGDDIVISKDTLHERMNAMRGAEADFFDEAYAHYTGLVKPDHHERAELPELGEVDAYFKIGDANLPNRVAMIRQTGMVIYKQGFRGLRVKYAGAFVCRNKHGNELLRAMEPPRHDDWDANLPEKGVSRGIQSEFRGWLRRTLVGLSPKVETTMLEADELADYLPDTITPDGQAGGNNSSNDYADGLTDNPGNLSEPQIEVITAPSNKKAELDIDGMKERIDPKEPDEPTDDDKPPTDKDTEDDTKPNGPPAVVFTKSFADAKANEYVIFVKSDKSTTVNLSISVVGEDAFTESIRPVSARDRDSNEPLTVSGVHITSVQLKRNTPRRLGISFGDSTHYAVNIIANEI